MKRLAILKSFCGCGLLISIAGCGSSSGDKSGSDGGPGGSCKSVAICTSIAQAHVDQLCGTTTANTSTVDITTPFYADTCQYLNSQSNTPVELDHACFPAVSGDVNSADSFYKDWHDKPGQNDVTTDLSGLGDQAALRTNGDTAQLEVQKGTLVVSAQYIGTAPQVPPTIKDQCLVPLVNELLAL